MSDLAEVITSEQIKSRVGEMAASLEDDYREETPVFVAVLQGAVPFLADLIRGIGTKLEVDFLALNRFGEGGQVRIAYDPVVSLTGRHVVLVEDIVDTGLTLSALQRMLEAREPASLKTITLIDKVPRRIVDVPIEYRGFEVGDEFLVGYGLDWEGKYRNLGSVWAVLDIPAFHENPEELAALVF